MKRRIECVVVPERRVFLFGYPSAGVSLKYVSGPDETKEIKPGSWLDMWSLENGKRQFHFGSFPQKNAIFATKELALAAKAELEMVGVITEVAE
jgi:hypothetical protein